MEQTMEPVAQTTPGAERRRNAYPCRRTGQRSNAAEEQEKAQKDHTPHHRTRIGDRAWLRALPHFGKKEGAGEQQVVKDTVMYGSITSTVEGSGMVKAKNSETITLATAGTVTDVFVTEGQQVMAGGSALYLRFSRCGEGGA